MKKLLVISLILFQSIAMAATRPKDIVTDEYVFKSSSKIDRGEEEVVIRIAFLYTKEIQESLSIKTIDKKIESQVRKTNDTFNNTGLSVNVESAYIGPWTTVDFKELSAKQIYLKLRDNYSSKLEKVKNKYSADVVFVVDELDLGKDSYCGWAKINTIEDLKNKETSFGLIRLNVRCPDVVPHELGHLLGSAHIKDGHHEEKIGHGIICNERPTIMAYGDNKYYFYSNPMIMMNGDQCGDIDHADNATLFKTTAPLLANINEYVKPLSEVDIYLEEAKSNVAKVTLYRSGVLDEKSIVEWTFGFNVKKQELKNYSVTFEEGEVAKTIEILVPKLTLPKNKLFSVLVRNPINTVLTKNELYVVTSDNTNAGDEITSDYEEVVEQETQEENTEIIEQEVQNGGSLSILLLALLLLLSTRKSEIYLNFSRN